ncbi:hypothetical protein Patl1_14755 [Pistacia atlantica]|uniref:Uncharacterized protein n=1 Tax=Pistacia atlantica TaxID=434234 RepID=A0ACC1ASJ9_9ROSI|nr:hypothetical protein Patl1_14755 [Pistacia atlantica]
MSINHDFAKEKEVHKEARIMNPVHLNTNNRFIGAPKKKKNSMIRT